MPSTDLDFIRELIERNRYLILSTTDGADPWIAPLEYVSDEELHLYFFSPEETLHAEHIDQHGNVAVAIFDAAQPEYEPAPVIRIAGVQMQAGAEKMAPPYPPLIDDQIASWGLPMPPYAVYRITPQRLFVPVIREGVNRRIEVPLD